MLTIRRVLVSTATVFTLSATASFVVGQNSPLPLQPGQSQQEEVATLIAVLQSADAGDHDKAISCKRLAVIGTKEAVPALAALLSDEKFGHYARYGLEPIPDPSVDAALRKALGQLNGQLLVGVINSIGARKDAQAARGLSGLLSDGNAAVAQAAAAALGRIATAEASKLLRAALADAKPANRAAVADACLACAEALAGQGKKDDAAAMYDAVRKADVPEHLKVAATYGAIMVRGAAGVHLLVEQLKADDEAFFGVGLRAARQLDGSRIDDALLAEVKKASPKKKALLLLCLADRGTKVALPAALEAAKRGPADLRLAAICSLKKLGDASALPVLLEAVQDEEAISQAAQATLAELPGENVDNRIIAALQSGDRSVRLIMIDLAGRRGIASAVPALTQAAGEQDEEVRLAAIRSLGTTIGSDDLSFLTGRLMKADAAEQQAAVRDALNAAVIRMPDREKCAAKLVDAMAAAPLEAKLFLLDLLGSIGGSTALDAVYAAATDANPQIQDAATRLLGEWMTFDAAPKLLELAKTHANKSYRIRAMRGYIRFPRQFDMPVDQRVEMCRKAMAAAERDDEKRLVLESLRRNPSPETLTEAVKYFDEPKLKGPASVAAVVIAESIVDAEPALVADAMQEVIAAGVAPDRVEQAKALLEKAKQ